MARLTRIALCMALGFSAFFVAGLAAAGSAKYRIEMSDGRQILATDLPVARGSVLTYHPYPAGPLTGVPTEMIVRVVSDKGTETRTTETTMTVRGTRLSGGPTDRTRRAPTVGLEPGEILVLGSTGDGIAPSAPAAAAAGTSIPNSGTGNTGGAYGAGAYGGGVSPSVVNPNVPIDPNNMLVGSDGLARVPSSTDLSRAQAAQNPVGPNGFPVTGSGAPTVIGPNGTPTLAPGVAGSGTPVTGPNGTPVMSSGAPQVQIGPNGTPVVAPSGQPAQPAVGPNGTPVLAQPGQPGAAQPNIGPNGTPVLAQPGQPGSAPPSTAPNGTPSSAPAGAAPSGGGSPSGSGPGRS